MNLGIGDQVQFKQGTGNIFYVNNLRPVLVDRTLDPGKGGLAAGPDELRIVQRAQAHKPSGSRK